MDHFVELKSWIPRHQFGFRRGRSATDCISVFVIDIMQDFARHQRAAALALDLKEAFNALLFSKFKEQV